MTRPDLPPWAYALAVRALGGTTAMLVAEIEAQYASWALGWWRCGI